MRFRISLLFLLASLLGTPVLLYRANMQQRCGDVGYDVCRAISPDPVWVRPAGILSAFILACVAALFAQAWTARHREKEMLDQVGVHVREEDLPLEE